MNPSDSTLSCNLLFTLSCHILPIFRTCIHSCPRTVSCLSNGHYSPSHCHRHRHTLSHSHRHSHICTFSHNHTPMYNRTHHHTLACSHNRIHTMAMPRMSTSLPTSKPFEIATSLQWACRWSSPSVSCCSITLQFLVKSVIAYSPT